MEIRHGSGVSFVDGGPRHHDVGPVAGLDGRRRLALVVDGQDGVPRPEGAEVRDDRVGRAPHPDHRQPSSGPESGSESVDRVSELGVGPRSAVLVEQGDPPTVRGEAIDEVDRPCGACRRGRRSEWEQLGHEATAKHP